MSESDEWLVDESIALSQERIKRILDLLHETPVIVEHGHYRGASAPTWRVLHSRGDLLEYLREHVRAGDSLHFWRLDRACPDDSRVTWGKVPDEHGRVPLGGAY